MSSDVPCVFVVDDDLSVRKGLERLLAACGYRVQTFGSAKELLEHEPQADSGATVGCLVLDVCLPGLNGLQLQRALAERGHSLPIVFITGHGDIPMSVKAMKAGAVDFLSKPFTEDALLGAVKQALAKCRHEQTFELELTEVHERLAMLTAREGTVLRHVIAGELNKQIAADLGIAEKTVKIHRGRVMHKLQVQSVADLVRLAQRGGIEPARKSSM